MRFFFWKLAIKNLKINKLAHAKKKKSLKNRKAEENHGSRP